MSDAKPPFLKRVRIENFRSIAHCDVHLQPLTLLVGPNGSGKTNFLDALRLVAESLRRPWDEIGTSSGGPMRSFGVSTLFGQHPERIPLSDFLLSEPSPACAGVLTPLVIELGLGFPSGGEAKYALTLAPPFRIQEETCVITDGAPDAPPVEYRVVENILKSSTLDSLPPPSSDRPYLTIASAFPAFRPVYDVLRLMRFYDIRPHEVCVPAARFAADQLRWDGFGMARVLSEIGQTRPQVEQRIDDYMRAILPGLVKTWVEPPEELPHFLLRFDIGRDDGNVVCFDASSMSNGTLHALGILVALFQCRDLPPESAIPLVAIEEPEANLHPGAAEVLMDAMTEASGFTQVLATTHSPDFLDYPDLDPESLLVFDAASGETIVDTADDVSKSAIRGKLYSAGELMRMQQLRPRSLQAPTSPAQTPQQ